MSAKKKNPIDMSDNRTNIWYVMICLDKKTNVDDRVFRVC